MKALAIALALTSLTSAGCDRCSVEKKQAAPVEARPERDVPAPVREVPDREAPPVITTERVRRNAPLDLEQATAMMPPLIGTQLGAPTMSQAGDQARFPFCLGAANLVEAGRRAEEVLAENGWTHVTPRPPDPDAPTPRYGMAAERDNYRISITIEALPRPDCDAESHKFYATAAMNKVSAPTTPE